MLIFLDGEHHTTCNPTKARNLEINGLRHRCSQKTWGATGSRPAGPGGEQTTEAGISEQHSLLYEVVVCRGTLPSHPLKFKNAPSDVETCSVWLPELDGKVWEGVWFSVWLIGWFSSHRSSPQTITFGRQFWKVQMPAPKSRCSSIPVESSGNQEFYLRLLPTNFTEHLRCTRPALVAGETT